MSERPIPFSAPMVRAILAGTKTQTRRLWKLPRGCDWYAEMGGERDGWFVDQGQPWWLHVSECRCPYGQPGDRLWVREAWARTTVFPGSEIIVYREGDNRTDYGGPWKPSIHMPRAASRITLEITGVRVERLQGISRGDAMAEGCPFPNMAQGDDPRQWFADLWTQINGPGSWDANPWVWCIEFRRLEAGNV